MTTSLDLLRLFRSVPRDIWLSNRLGHTLRRRSLGEVYQRADWFVKCLTDFVCLGCKTSSRESVSSNVPSALRPFVAPFCTMLHLFKHFRPSLVWKLALCWIWVSFESKKQPSQANTRLSTPTKNLQERAVFGMSWFIPDSITFNAFDAFIEICLCKFHLPGRTILRHWQWLVENLVVLLKCASCASNEPTHLSNQPVTN